jgi:hypothetical protein
LSLFAAVAAREWLQVTPLAIVILALLQGMAWSMMVWRVWHNPRVAPERRVVWMVLLILAGGAAVPIYFNRYVRSETV